MIQIENTPNLLPYQRFINVLLLSNLTIRRLNDFLNRRDLEPISVQDYKRMTDFLKDAIYSKGGDKASQRSYLYEYLYDEVEIIDENPMKVHFTEKEINTALDLFSIRDMWEAFVVRKNTEYKQLDISLGAFFRNRVSRDILRCLLILGNTPKDISEFLRVNCKLMKDFSQIDWYKRCFFDTDIMDKETWDKFINKTEMDDNLIQEVMGGNTDYMYSHFGINETASEGHVIDKIKLMTAVAASDMIRDHKRIDINKLEKITKILKNCKDAEALFNTGGEAAMDDLSKLLKEKTSFDEYADKNYILKELPEQLSVEN